jgi:hypothetical protein
MRRLLVAALFAFAFSQAPSLSANPPFNVNFTCRFDIETNDSQLYKNLAPWYTYFPYDPYAQTSATPRFPTWPSTWPPTGAPKGGAAPMTYRPAPANAWQPVSYQYAAPSYWYGR